MTLFSCDERKAILIFSALLFLTALIRSIDARYNIFDANPAVKNFELHYTDKNQVININTAAVAELTTLDGIGNVIAGRIIIMREEKGDFSSPDQLLDVKGIGPEKFKGIKDRITINDQVASR